MGIGIDGRGARVVPLRPLTRATQLRGTAFERLSSGLRINRAADDAAGLALAERLTALEVSVAQGSRNLNDAVSALRVADGALSETTSNLQRMRELSIQAQNGTLSDDQRAIVQQEIDALAGEVTRVSQNTDFNGRQLLSGETSGDGALTVADGTGSGEPLEVDLEDQSAAALGVASLDAADPATLARIDAALDRVSGTRTSLGATESRVESRIRSLAVTRENLASARSRIEDADVANEQANAVRAAILQQAAVGVQASQMLTSGVVLRLLGV